MNFLRKDLWGVFHLMQSFTIVQVSLIPLVGRTFNHKALLTKVYRWFAYRWFAYIPLFPLVCIYIGRISLCWLSKGIGIHHVIQLWTPLGSVWKFAMEQLTRMYTPKTNMEPEHTLWKETFTNHQFLWVPCLFSDVQHVHCFFHILWRLVLQNKRQHSIMFFKSL